MLQDFRTPYPPEVYCKSTAMYQIELNCRIKSEELPKLSRGGGYLDSLFMIPKSFRVFEHY